MMNWSTASSDGHENAIVVNTPSFEVLRDELAARLEAGEGFTVATLNLDHVVKLRRDPVFRSAYARHSHVVADGNPIVWLARLSGQKIFLVPGSELVEPIAALAAAQAVPVALVGATDASLATAESALKKRYPGLSVVARIAPPMGFDPMGEEAAATIEAIGASGACLCLLALGAPRQEIFAIRAHERLPQTGFLSIGAGLDFIAGSQKRAPAWVRVIAAEWIWRMATNPRRLTGRYAACIAILPTLLGSALKTRRAGRT